MEIFIRYSSKWNLSAKAEDKVSATKNLSYANLTKGTCLGVLARLMGQVDKMHNLKKEFPLILKIEEGISFEDLEVSSLDDILFLRSHNQPDGNQSGGMAGKILEHELFKDPRVIVTYGVLFLDIDEILEYLLTGKLSKTKLEEKSKKISPSLVWQRMQCLLSKEYRNFKFEDQVLNSLKKEAAIFSKKHELKAVKRQTASEQEPGVYVSSIYNFAINKYYLENIKTLKDFEHLSKNIPGFAGSNPLGSITPRAWMNVFSSRTKLTTGTFINSLNTDVMPLGTYTKQDGIVKITLSGLTLEDQKFVLDSIESNGVSSFVLGKKGLAYLEKVVL